MITELDVYQQEAIRTAKPMSSEQMNNYCVMKICEEAGEISGLITKHHFHGKPFAKDRLKEEISDLLWYVSAIAHTNGFTLSEVATFNIDKLRQRHGQQYNQEFYQH